MQCLVFLALYFMVPKLLFQLLNKLTAFFFSSLHFLISNIVKYRENVYQIEFLVHPVFYYCE